MIASKVACVNILGKVEIARSAVMWNEERRSKLDPPIYRGCERLLNYESNTVPDLNSLTNSLNKDSENSETMQRRPGEYHAFVPIMIKLKR